jgi:hypothetical protein
LVLRPPYSVRQEFSRVDLLTQLLGFLFGFLPQLPLKHYSAPFILAERLGVVAR